MHATPRPLCTTLSQQTASPTENDGSSTYLFPLTVDFLLPSRTAPLIRIITRAGKHYYDDRRAHTNGVSYNADILYT